jgi:hypothetical protein
MKGNLNTFSYFKYTLNHKLIITMILAQNNSSTNISLKNMLAALNVKTKGQTKNMQIKTIMHK